MADEDARRRPRRPAWTRCSHRRTSTTGCSPTERWCRSTCRTGSDRSADAGGNDVQPARTQECLTRRDAGVLPPARPRRGLGPADNTLAARVPTADYEQVAWTRDGTLWLPGRRRTPADRTRGTTATTSTVAGRSRVPVARPSSTGWTGTGAPTTDGPGQFANPEFLAGRPTGGARSPRPRHRAEQDVLPADGVVQPRLPVVPDVRPATGRTGCWPGGSARRTCTASATTPTSRARASRRAGRRTRSASRGARSAARGRPARGRAGPGRARGGWR